MDISIESLSESMSEGMESLSENYNNFFAGGKHGFNFIRIDVLSEKLGTSQVLLRFLIGIFAGYPLSIVYLLLPKHTKKTYKHLFFAVTGLLINYFCFGSDCMYNIFSIVVTYLSLLIFGGTIQNVIFAFIFHTTYLTIGYIKNASDTYDVKWTTPQCVLCLRLIGLMWNVYDGVQKEETLSEDQKKLCVKHIPTFLEVFGYSYCFCGFLTGLQYSFKLYLDFVEEALLVQGVKVSGRLLECFKRFVGALSVLLVFQLLDPSFRCDSLLKDEFLQRAFCSKVLHMAIVYFVQYSKYIIVWWFGESVCILLGLGFNGLDKNGVVRWDGVRNFKFRVFVFGPFYQDIVDGFNIHTNQWSGRYVFRRLKFLGNKSVSHGLTLLYLAIWHGFYVGYFIMFFLEFAYVLTERQYCSVARKLFKVSYAELPFHIQFPLQVVLATYKWISCGFAAASFLLLKWNKIKIVFATSFYWPFIPLALWYILIVPTLDILMPKDKKTKETPVGKKED